MDIRSKEKILSMSWFIPNLKLKLKIENEYGMFIFLHFQMLSLREI